MKSYHLGINLGHDRSAAIVVDGEVVVAISQERLDRQKHSLGVLHQSLNRPDQTQLPSQAINYCLDSLGISLEDLSSITANMPGRDFSLNVLRSQLPSSVHKKCFALPSHHLGHAYTAYYPSGFDDALIISVDATGNTDEKHQTESYSVYRGTGSEINLLHSEKCFSPWAEYGTLGFIYEQVTRLAGFVTKLGKHVKIPEAGKLMGLAPYGKTQDKWQRWITPIEDSYSLEISPYDIALEIEALKYTYQKTGTQNHHSPWIVDLAYKAQTEIEEALLHIVSHGLKQTGLNKVCLAGGVALNSVANNRLAIELGLDDIFIFPAAGDAGIAVGCAYHGYHESCIKQKSSVKRNRLKTASFGKSYHDEEILKSIEKYSDLVDYEILSEKEILERTCDAISSGLVVSRFEGGSEFGPRALGNRSILADPSFEGIQDIINARVKGRERYRPFAPVVPEEDSSTYFEQELKSPFMLLVSGIREQYHSEIPSVTHVDGTGRIQTVNEQDNNFLFRLCKLITTKRKGPPIILNTSYNLAGEPIVESPEDALKSFCATDMDYLAIENILISKKVSAGDYSEKLAKIQEEKSPAGLPPNQGSTLSTMRYLDNLLFASKNEGDSAFVKELSAKISHLKPTSKLFGLKELPQAPLNDHVYCVVNPLEKSYLIDLRNNQKSRGFNFDEIDTILALSKKDEIKLQAIRKNAQLSTLEWGNRLKNLQSECAPYVSIALPEQQHSPLHASKSLLKGVCGPYAKNGYSCSTTLLKFRETLIQTGYDCNNICSVLGIESLQDIEPTRIYYYEKFLLGNEPLDILIKLFLLQSKIPQETVKSLLSDEVCQYLESIEILVSDGIYLYSNIDIFCVDGLLIATDHRYQLKGITIDEQPVMYIGLDSLGLVNVGLRYAAGEALDLCSGSGVQALVASKYCDHVTGVDINPRAIRVSRFNADLNGITNVRFMEGDLYEALDGKASFDLILANPPFVPSPDATMKFRDGGTNGERILARIVDGASDRLSEKGRLQLVTDLVDVPIYEDKLAVWWGDCPADKLVLHTADRDEILFSVPHTHKPFDQSYAEYNETLDRWINSYRKSGISKVNFGYVIIQKSATSSYYARAVHSPKSKVADAVADYFATKKKLASLESSLEKYQLTVESKMRFRHQMDLDGSNEVFELYVPDNPYFTTYQVDAEIFNGLNSIGKSRPQFSQFVNAANKDWVYDLILKGLLRLDVFEKEDIKSVERRGSLSKIVESESKTTPTCVSSYLA